MCDLPFPVPFLVPFPIGNFFEISWVEEAAAFPAGREAFPVEVPQFPAHAGYRVGGA